MDCSWIPEPRRPPVAYVLENLISHRLGNDRLARMLSNPAHEAAFTGTAGDAARS
jgi:hypothetical protein